MNQCSARTDVVTRLDPGAVYLSPVGRRCRVWQSTSDVVHLIYDRRAGTPAARNDFSEGFNLTFANLRFLRRVA